MEGEKGLEQKMGTNEVVVLISGIQEASKTSNQKPESGSPSFSKNIQIFPPNADSMQSRGSKSKPQMSGLQISSPEIIKLSPQHPNKTSKIPDEAVIRRRNFSPSAYTKPKSRLVEPSYPNDSHLVEEHTHLNPPVDKVTTSTPKEAVRTTPKTPSEYEEEDDEVYKTTKLQEDDNSGKRLKIMVLLEWILLICIIGVLIASLTVHELKHHMIWGLEIWKWSVLVLVIFCGRLVTGWSVNIVVFLIERNYLLKKKVLYFVYSLKKSVRVFIWLALVLLAWDLLINRGVKRSKKTTRTLNYITRALASCLFGAGLWMVKTFLVKLLASSFHVTRFFDRIQESIFHQYVLQTLSGPPSMDYEVKVGSTRMSGQLSLKKSTKKGKKEKEGVIDVEKLHKIKQEKISAWTMGGLMKVISSSGLSTITSALDEYDDDEGVEQKEITSEWEAKAAAIRIFKNVAKPGNKYVDEEDLLRFMEKEEVDNVLPLFEGATETGKIKRKVLRNWVVNVYNERKSLAHSLNDTKTAVEELNRIASGVAVVVILIVWLLLMGFASTQVLLLISSQLLLVVFVFGNACKTAFEAIIFVFVMHPFDVGDRCVIDGVQMVVEEMNILTTIFLRYDNEKIFYPNSVLATKPISNFYRSPEMGDSVEFAVDVSTSAENVVALKAKIKGYLESKPQHWRPNHTVQIKEIEDVNKMKMALYINHTINFQNYAEKATRRSDLVFELKHMFEEIGIKYHLLPQEVYLSNVDSAASNFTTVPRR